jgi:hypothetical protein
MEFARRVLTTEKALARRGYNLSSARGSMIIYDHTRRRITRTGKKPPELETLVDSPSQPEARSSTPPADAPALSGRARLGAPLQNWPLAILGLGALLTLGWVALLTWVVFSFLMAMT